MTEFTDQNKELYPCCYDSYMYRYFIDIDIGIEMLFCVEYNMEPKPSRAFISTTLVNKNI